MIDLISIGNNCFGKSIYFLCEEWFLFHVRLHIMKIIRMLSGSHIYVLLRKSCKKKYSSLLTVVQIILAPIDGLQNNNACF